MYEFKVKNKNIIITDPCYLDNVMNKNDETEELRNYWLKFLGSDFCDDDCSDRLKKFGFTDNLCCGTIYGDWSCSVYKVDFDPREIRTIEDLTKLEENPPINRIGGFCADAGMVCAVDSEELKKFNPNFFEWALFHKHCVAPIYNFSGEIGIIDIDPKEKDFPHFRYRLVYGVTEKETPYGYNFLAYQTGL